MQEANLSQEGRASLALDPGGVLGEAAIVTRGDGGGEGVGVVAEGEGAVNDAGSDDGGGVDGGGGDIGDSGDVGGERGAAGDSGLDGAANGGLNGTGDGRGNSAGGGRNSGVGGGDADDLAVNALGD